VLGAVALGTALPAVPSSASTYYDYWGYWHKPASQQGAGAWQYSTVGPSGYYLQKGAQVEGWRYAIGTASQSDPKPRPVDVTYGDHCHDTTSTYRVLLIVDYGTQSGAPSGPVYSCYGFSDAKTGYDVLTQQHTERDSGGLICAIDAYPKTGCGDVVSSPAPKPTARTSTPEPSPSASPPPSAYVAPNATSPTPTPASKSSGPASPSHPPTTKPAASTTASPTPASSQTIVAKQFVPPHRRGGVPYGFVAGGVFVAALIGAVVWQRRRRAG